MASNAVHSMCGIAQPAQCGIALLERFRTPPKCQSRGRLSSVRTRKAVEEIARDRFKAALSNYFRFSSADRVLRRAVTDRRAFVHGILLAISQEPTPTALEVCYSTFT